MLCNTVENMHADLGTVTYPTLCFAIVSLSLESQYVDHSVFTTTLGEENNKQDSLKYSTVAILVNVYVES